MTRITQGQVVALFAFDVGYEVSLDRLAALSAATPAQPISRKKQTPPYLQYTRPPQVLNLGAAEPLAGRAGVVQARVFDFGAVSISFRWPLAGAVEAAADAASGAADDSPAALPLDELPALSHQLYNCNLEAEAEAKVRVLLEGIRPAVTEPHLKPLVEDYYLFILERLDAPLTGEELLARHRPALAQTLRFERQPLSAWQQEEALGQRVSYYEHDLVVLDWNAAVICDPDFEDTASVLELLNVELLEARYVDAQLDERIEQYARLVRRRAEWPLPLRTPHRREIKDLAELRVEASLLAERVNNSLKLIGDLYLARVHAAATRRFSLQEWEASVSRKLEIIGDFYELLTDRVRQAQSQTLELVIILLILVEIVLGLLG